MAQWAEIGKSGVTGLAAGVADQLIQNNDEKSKRAFVAIPANAGKTLSIWKQIGTYYNYGLPIVLTVACAADAVKGAWADRLMTVAGQLIGRKATAQITSATQSAPRRGPAEWRPLNIPQRQRASSPAERTYELELETVGSHAF